MKKRPTRMCTVERQGSRFLVLSAGRCIGDVPIASDAAIVEGQAYKLAEDFVTGRIADHASI
ncbi:hypothetical protein [Azospirillum sp.]|uniref:hypothetical protein n=1 Tax=Azospirillum sp. TaxID=34012 RepID=UPI002D4D0F4F|nr:hypothetical protein [Azospirillum sp.]HYD69289.1 hypothetical protein [Azospirillum sp.]